MEIGLAMAKEKEIFLGEHWKKVLIPNVATNSIVELLPFVFQHGAVSHC